MKGMFNQMDLKMMLRIKIRIWKRLLLIKIHEKKQICKYQTCNNSNTSRWQCSCKMDSSGHSRWVTLRHWDILLLLLDTSEANSSLKCLSELHLILLSHKLWQINTFKDRQCLHRLWCLNSKQGQISCSKLLPHNKPRCRWGLRWPQLIHLRGYHLKILICKVPLM